jgi:hypothetical protein
MQNIVLYTVGAKHAGKHARQPIFSCAPDDPMASVKIMQKCSDALSLAERSGVAAPLLQVVLEERKANESGAQTSAEFTLLDFATLKPLKAKSGVKELAELDPKGE